MDRLDYIARQDARLTVTGAPQGYDAYLAAQAARRRKGPVLFVALDDTEAQTAQRTVAFFAPGLAVLPFPAWDCLPYDRVSPKPDIESRRLATLAALARDPNQPCVVVTTINALLQRVPPLDAIKGASFAARNGAEVDRDALVAFLSGNGYVPRRDSARAGATSRCAAASWTFGPPLQGKWARTSRCGWTFSARRWTPSAASMPKPNCRARRWWRISRCCPPVKRR